MIARAVIAIRSSAQVKFGEATDELPVPSMLSYFYSADLARLTFPLSTRPSRLSFCQTGCVRAVPGQLLGCYVCH